MIVAVIVFLLSTLMAAVLWKASVGVFEAYVFQRHNYRDHTLPTGVGVIIPLVVAAIVALEVLFDPWRSYTTGSWVDFSFLRYQGGRMVAICIAFSFLGLIDDLGGVGESGGFRGHIRALFVGRITTGMVKLAGGAVIALAVVGDSPVYPDRASIIRDAAIVCLAANLGNLFDRAPGRAIKAGFAAFVVLVAFTWDGRIALAALPMGAAAGLLRVDLREEMMIGDAGANALGAGLGFAAVAGSDSSTRWWLLAVLLLLNLASEIVSFSKVIDAVGPLRWLDRLGSRRATA